MTTDRDEAPGEAPADAPVLEPSLDEREYFLTGRWHVEHVFGVLGRLFEPALNRPRVLDLGCGRGRITLALAERAARVTAVESRRCWLDEAQRHARARGQANIQWVLAADPELPPFQERFDLVHAAVTPERKGPAPRPALEDLLPLLAPGGRAALHLPLRGRGTRGLAGALSSLRQAGVRQCHVEFGTGPGAGGAMLYFTRATA